MMSIYFTFSLSSLFFFNLILLGIIFIVNLIRKKIYFKATHQELKNSYNLFLKYIDRYYILNLKYTIAASFMYIISTIIIFLIIRYTFLGQINVLSRLETSMIINYSNLIKIIFKYLAFLMMIYSYKILLQILFYKEIIKLRIYVQKYEIIITINKYCRFKFGEYICKIIWMLSYRIAMQKFSDNLFEGDYDSWKDTALDYDEHDFLHVYYNKYINKIINCLVCISKNYAFISLLFYYNAKLFKFITRHISNGLFKFIPYMLIILCLLYDLYYRNLYFVYYATFYYFIYYILLNLRKFEQNLDTINIRRIKDYFYENDYSYLSQRFYIMNTEDYNNNNSKQNLILFTMYNSAKNNTYSGLIFSVLKNMTERTIFTKHEKKYQRRHNFLYLRATIILTFIIINIFISKMSNIELFIFNIVTSKLIIFIPTLIMIILATRIMYSIIESEFAKDENYAEFKYNIIYSVFFWFLVLLHFYLYWLIILKPELTFMYTEILIDLPWDILKIIKIYSEEEKIVYFKHIFENSLKTFNMFGQSKQDLDNLRLFVNEIILEDLITNDMALYDIKGLVIEIFNKYKEHFFNRYEIIALESENKDSIINYLTFYIKTKRFLYKYWRGGNSFFNTINETFINNFVNSIKWEEIFVEIDLKINPFPLEDLFDKYVEEQSKIFLLNYVRNLFKCFAIISKIIGNFKAIKHSVPLIKDKDNINKIIEIIKYIWNFLTKK